MGVANVRITNIKGNRNDNVEVKENIEIKSNFKIDSIKKEGKDLLVVNFSFEVAYKPNVGDIELEGRLWYRSDELDKIAEVKEEGVVLQPDVIKEVSTAILRESMMESSFIARKLRLPVPIKLPEITANFQSAEFKKAS